jgi:hypothetical protein
VTSNPYQSPADVDVSEPAGQTRQWAPLRYVGIGLFFGSIVGGTCGAAHAVIVAITVILLQVYGVAPTVAPVEFMPEFAIVFLLAVTIAGALVGLPIGLVIGFVLGLLAGVCGPQSRRSFYVVGITTATFSGAIASGLLAIVPPRTPPEAAFVLNAITLTSGTLAGFLGGLCLVRGLAKLTWRRSLSGKPVH